MLAVTRPTLVNYSNRCSFGSFMKKTISDLPTNPSYFRHVTGNKNICFGPKDVSVFSGGKTSVVYSGPVGYAREAVINLRYQGHHLQGHRLQGHSLRTTCAPGLLECTASLLPRGNFLPHTHTQTHTHTHILTNSLSILAVFFKMCDVIVKPR